MRKLVKEFVALGFGAVGFGLAFVLGTAVTSGTGVPLLGGVTNGVLVAMVLTIGLLAVDRFGTAVQMWLMFSLFAAFTTTLGPQGFYKIPIALLAGLLWDAVYFGFRRRTYALFLGAFLGVTSIMFAMLGALRLGLGRDAEVAFQKYWKALGAILVINLIVTGLGVFLGRQVYLTRLARLELFKNLKA
ncbi:MAG: hypothetical protein JW889_03360 [Verrucomicrobia bacterium]|nr:hypothetical protein [Verrucomicrobiota bacterium]